MGRKAKRFWKKYGKGTMSLRKFMSRLQKDVTYRNHIAMLGPSEYGFTRQFKDA